MASTYTNSLRLTLQGIGENKNTWGNILNTVIELVDDSVAGCAEVSVTGATTDVTLSTANGATDEARKAFIKLTGIPTTNRNVIIPAVCKFYVIDAQFTGSYTITVKTASGTGVGVTAGSKTLLYCDGTDVFSFGVPSKVISLFYGAIADIPAGYALCDGTNGTPDLRDKFVVGARQDDSGIAKTNLTGSLTQSGSENATADAAGGHNHGGNTGSTVLTISQMPPHSHTVSTETSSNTGGEGSVAERTGGATNSETTSTVGGGEGHDHTISSVTDHTHTISNIYPAYFALAFIMKV